MHRHLLIWLACAHAAEGLLSDALATGEQTEITEYRFKIHNYGYDKYLCLSTTCPFQNTRCGTQSQLDDVIYVQWMDWDEDSSDNNCWWKRSKGSSNIQPYYRQDHCLLLDLQWTNGCHEIFDSCGSIVLVALCSSPVTGSAKSWHRIKVDQGYGVFELLSSNVIDGDAPWLNTCTSSWGLPVHVGTPQCLEWNENNGNEHGGFERVADSYYCYAPWMWANWSAAMKTEVLCEFRTQKASCRSQSCSLFESCSCSSPGYEPFSAFCWDCSCQATAWKLILGALGAIGSTIGAAAGALKCFLACRKCRHERSLRVQRAQPEEVLEVPLTL